MLRVGMLSSWHVHARGYAEELKNISNVHIAAVWDELPDRGKQWAGELNVPFVPDLDAFVSRDDVDAVVVDAPTNRHAEVMIAAAKAKKHIFTEKVMALTVRECDEIAEAVRQAGVKFCISFPARTTRRRPPNRSRRCRDRRAACRRSSSRRTRRTPHCARG